MVNQVILVGRISKVEQGSIELAVTLKDTEELIYIPLDVPEVIAVRNDIVCDQLAAVKAHITSADSGIKLSIDKISILS
jgi:hypothetical protein